MSKERSGRDREFDELWAKGEKAEFKVTPKKDRMTVFSMKLDRNLLRALVEQAKEKGVGPSTLARELLEEGLVAGGRRVSTDTILEILMKRLRALAEQGKFLTASAEPVTKSAQEALDILGAQEEELYEAADASTRYERIAS